MKRAWLLGLVLWGFGALFAQDVVVVAREPGYYTSLARHLQEGLKRQSIAADCTDAKALATKLASARFAFLVGFVEPSATELTALRNFCRRGGRLAVFYSRSAALGELMGVKPCGYTAAPHAGAWSRLDFVATRPAGMPATIRQNSQVLERAVAIPGRSRVIATWSDARGSATGENAVLQSANGFWMTHVLLPDTDQDLKGRLAAAMVGAAFPDVWSAAAQTAREASIRAAWKRQAESEPPRAGEMHAVWDHGGWGLYRGDWPRTMRTLAAAGVTDLFLNVAGAGFAHYASRTLPRSSVYQVSGDQLAAALAAARGTGIRVHAWVLCFTATRGTQATLADYARRGWRLRSRQGALTEYLDPGRADVRRQVITTVNEIQNNYAVHGIHLDFVRWYEGATQPPDAAAIVTRFVAEVRRHVKRPRLLTAAVLGKYPDCVKNVAQDWQAWLASDLIDYAVPMNYVSDRTKFLSLLRQQAANPACASRTIVGLGVSANESTLSFPEVLDQVKCVRRFGLPGVALFNLNSTMERDILPYLSLGPWRKPPASLPSRKR